METPLSHLSYSLSVKDIAEMSFEAGPSGVSVMYRATVRVELVNGGCFKEATGYFVENGSDGNEARGLALDGAIQRATERALALLSGGTTPKASAAPVPVQQVAPVAAERPQPVPRGGAPAGANTSSNNLGKSQKSVDLNKAKAEEDAKRKKQAEEEEAARKRQQEEEEERKRQEEEEEDRKRQEEEEEERRRQQEEEEERKRQEEEEQERKRKEEEEEQERKRQEEEEERKRKEEEEEQERRRQEEEEEAKKKQEEEEERLRKEEEEAQKKREEEEAALKKQQQEEEAKKKEEAAAAAALKKSPTPVRPGQVRPPGAAPAAGLRSSGAAPGGAAPPAAGAGRGRASPSVTPAAAAAAGGAAGGARKQLSLSSRKNVKQFQPQFTEHATAIQEALGMETQIQSKVDWVPLADKCDEGGHKFACGEIFYDKIMKGLVANLSQLAGTEGRDALIKEWSAGGISMRFNPEQAQQFTIVFENGDMEIVSRGEPWEETETVGADLLERFGGGGGAANNAPKKAAALDPTAHADNFAKHASDIQAAAALSKPVTQVNVNYQDLQQHTKANASEQFQEHVMAALADTFNTYFANTMCQHVLKRVWATGQLSFAINAAAPKPFSGVFQKGVLVITATPDGFNGDLKGVLSDLLDKEADDETGLPIPAALSMKEFEVPQLEALVRQRSALGMEFDIVPDVDFYEICTYLKDPRSLGKLWLDILERLAFVIEDTVAKEPDAADRMIQLWTNAVLKVVFDESVDTYMLDFLEGDLLIVTSSLCLEDPSTLGDDLVDKIFQ